ncbi:MAG: N-6 DNA methylase [Candidatus Lokiarchaeota archaeon]|nr:N-6 DNA methylase [Candidatus Lokiarchaeota archaeon]
MNSAYLTMDKFITYLKKEGIIQDLLEFYDINQSKHILDTYFDKLIEILDKKGNIYASKNSVNQFKLKFNSLGKFYENNLHETERKSLGEFYTPKSIVDYILDAVDYKDGEDIQNKKLVDISCGSGSFIILAIRVLINNCVKSFNKKDISEISPKEARYIILKVNENISGIDINPIACILCQINIHLELFDLLKVIKDKDKNYHLPQFSIKNSNTFTILKSEIYDFIVGNPPYLFIRDIPDEQKLVIEKGDFDTNNGQYDYYQIFIELGIRLLKNKGKLGYIVPDSLLVLSNRSILRKYIYNTTKIREIYETGPKFEDPIVSNIILVLEKESDMQEREKNSIKVKISDQIKRDILQKDLQKWDYKFLIHLSKEDLFILNHLKKFFPTLKDLMMKKDFNILLSRGIELTKKGEIIFCENCRKYFPVPKRTLDCPECKKHLKERNIELIISDFVPEEEEGKFELFINSINRYKVKNYKYVKVDKPGINYKDFNIYSDRIIIRQLSQNSLICATYEKKFSLTSQSFYNLRVYSSAIKEFNNLYLLGIINSKLLSYYFIKLFGSYKRLFPRILIEKIKDFPISIPGNLNEKKLASQIIKKVEILLNLNEGEEEKSKKIQREIDEIIFKLYRIPDLYKEKILEFV